MALQNLTNLLPAPAAAPKPCFRPLEGDSKALEFKPTVYTVSLPAKGPHRAGVRMCGRAFSCHALSNHPPPQAPADWPAVPAEPYHAPGPVRQHQKQQRGQQRWASGYSFLTTSGTPRRQRPVVVDLIALDRMPLPPFDSDKSFADFTFPLRAPYCAETYYMLDLAQRVYKDKVPAWWVLVPRRFREM